MNATPMTSGRTITALFDKREEATSAGDELVQAGIPRAAIRIAPETDVATSAAPATSYDASADDKGFWASLKGVFMPDEDRYTYAEAMHRGSIMVSVSGDDVDPDIAEDILEKHGTVNVDEREASWRKDGWAGYAPTGMDDHATAPSGGGKLAAAGDHEAIQEVEEQLRVGKRQVNSGRVKVRSYVVETPVSEDVNLRSESVRIERRPVDRAVGDAENAFQERTIEAVATSEEAVVSKEARVTGEVLVHKDAADRVETVTDKVRSTKVEVEDDAARGNVTTMNKRR